MTTSSRVAGTMVASLSSVWVIAHQIQAIHTSAHACWEVTSCMLAAKRSPWVAPEVNLGKCTLHLPLQKANRAEPTLALKPRGDVTRNPKRGVPVAPKKIGHVSVKNFLKKV